MGERRRTARLIQRYAPVTALFGALCLLVALAPTRAPSQTRVALDQLTPGASPGAASTLPGSAADGGAATATSTGNTSTTVGPAGGGVAGAIEPSASGTSRGGVACGPGAIQVPWTVYAPPCLAAFAGDNGGTTTPGVDGSTITVSYRRSDSTQDAAAFAALGSPDFNDSSFIADLQTYISIFNRDYELYGRHVKLVDFQGRGDWLSEDQGQNLAAAQADASTAKDLGAFADVQFLYKATEAYETYLATNGVLTIGAPGLPQSFYERNAPWAYSPWPTGNKLAGWAVNTACQHLNGRTASFGGDDALRASSRVFAILTPDTPGYTASGALMEQGLAGCGAPVGRRIAYSLNIPTFQTQANSIIAQLRDAHVTTVICYCDPLMPAFLTQVADQQDFHPEWMAATLGPTDQLLRYSQPDQWAHAISNQGAFPSREQSEAYKVFKLANRNGEPQEEFYPAAYLLVLELFNGLQAAGPILTPTGFERGMFSLPPSGAGDFGTWRYGTGAFTPGSDTQVGWWSNTAISEFDGKPGGWQSCDDGAFLPYALDRRAEWGEPGSLRCFG